MRPTADDHLGPTLAAPPRRVPGVLFMFGLVLVGVLLGQTIWTRIDGARDASGAPTTGPSAPRAVAARGPLASDEQSTISLFKQTSPSVVFVTTLQRVRNRFTLDITEVPAGTGSGFIWDDQGHIVTNFHVTGPPRSSAYSVTLNNQKTYPAELIGVAPNNDLAVLKISVPTDEKLTPIPLGTSNDLQVGQSVMAIGNPFGLDQSLTTGVVSALGRTITSPSDIPIEDVIQTDAAINPGNSGGPLLDSSGRIIGVNAQIRSPSGSSAGVGFAIPIDTVNRIVPSILRNYREGHPSTPTQASLGINIAPDSVNARVSQMTGVQGVVVVAVTPDGPAEQAGVEPVKSNDDGSPDINDIITAIGGHRVSSRVELVAALGHFDPNDEVVVKLWKDGKERELKVKLGTAE